MTKTSKINTETNKPICTVCKHCIDRNNISPSCSKITEVHNGKPISTLVARNSSTNIDGTKLCGPHGKYFELDETILHPAAYSSRFKPGDLIGCFVNEGRGIVMAHIDSIIDGKYEYRIWSESTNSPYNLPPYMKDVEHVDSLWNKMGYVKIEKGWFGKKKYIRCFAE